MLVNTDVYIRMVFVWEETGVRVEAVRGECVNTAPASQPRLVEL